MRQSQLFTKTQKEAPRDEESINAQLLLRAGFIHKEMAGVYSYLPLGLRTLNKIIAIIREEMNNVGGQEILLTTLQNPEAWKKTGRWSDEIIDVWFKTQLANETEVGLGNTHEEAIAQALSNHIRSYKDLPQKIYQIQTKFRNELRARSGILRTREFLMKDMYSFAKDEEEHKKLYEKIGEAYMRIFERVGLKNFVHYTVASGGSFSKFSHEYQALCKAGEDTIYISKDKDVAINKEVFTPEVLQELGVKKEDCTEHAAIEVGNIFPLGTKYAEALGLEYQDEQGETHPVYMGSYGIGPGRVMGTIVELMHDDKGIIWPASIAPFQIHLIALEGAEKEADGLYEELQKNNTDTLYDDRVGVQAGEKFADDDLMGIPLRVVISKKTLAEKKAEVRYRADKKIEMVSLADLISFLSDTANTN